jgi:hypothetical protein
MNVESGFFVGQADLKREALIGKQNCNGVIETIIIHMSLRGGRSPTKQSATLLELASLPMVARNDIIRKR